MLTGMRISGHPYKDPPKLQVIYLVSFFFPLTKLRYLPRQK